MHVVRLVRVFLAIIICLAGFARPTDAASVASGPPNHWTLVNLGAAPGLAQVIWSGKKFVAVGRTAILSSANGLDWTAITPVSLERSLTSIACNGNIYVAVGEGGTILSSPDLTDWTTRSLGSTARYSSVFWLGNEFLAIGTGGVNAISLDGVTWTAGEAYGNYAFTHGTWSGSKLVVGANNSITTSNDGVKFSRPMDGTGLIADVAWGNGLFVAVGNPKNSILTSPDGGTWTKCNSGLTTILRGVCWTGKEFVAVGDKGVILTSTNGSDWEKSDLGDGQANLTSVTVNGAVVVAVSDTGAVYCTSAQPPAIKAALNTAPANATPAASQNRVAVTPLSGDQMKALVIIAGDVSVGTGFIAKMHNSFFIVTNQHVLSGNKKFSITGMDGTKYPTTGALFGAVDYDVAILKIPDDLAKHSLEIMTDPMDNAKVGSIVTVPGNSLGAGVPLQINGKLLGMGPELVEVDANFVPGNSGSPIIERHSGQVIGIATLRVTYKPDVTKQYGLTSDTRWFGYRLDNIDPDKGWQKLDWARFSAEGLKIEALKNLTKTMIAILLNQNPPLLDDKPVQQALESFKSDYAHASQVSSKQAFIDAYKQFHSRLHNIAVSDIQDLANMSLYPYHSGVLKEQQEWQTVLDAAYADVSKKIDALPTTGH